MFDTIRHPFFCIIYVRLTEEFKFNRNFVAHYE